MVAQLLPQGLKDFFFASDGGGGGGGGGTEEKKEIKTTYNQQWTQYFGMFPFTFFFNVYASIQSILKNKFGITLYFQLNSCFLPINNI